MARLRFDSEDQIGLLRWLDDLDRRECGYRQGGVFGWASHAHADAVLSYHIAELLPRLARLRLVDRRDVRYSERARPDWIYRITQAGSERTGHARTVVAPEFDRDTEDHAVRLPRGPQAALELLRQFHRAGTERDDGWVTTLQVREAAVLQAGPPIYSESLAWLARRGFADRRACGGTLHSLWRASDLGMETLLLRWHSDPRSVTEQPHGPPDASRSDGSLRLSRLR